ncbi:unnamed protein product, partial [Discosporangium mesarthrocarpum]
LQGVEGDKPSVRKIMEGESGELNPLYQVLYLTVDFNTCTVRGKTQLWLRHYHGDSGLNKIALHCRQCRVTTVKVNGTLTAHTHLDPLVQVVLPNYRDAEAFDLSYRACLFANAQDNSGELRFQPARSSKRVPDEFPPALPDHAPPAARARRDYTAQMILATESAEVDKRERAKAGLKRDSVGKMNLVSQQPGERSGSGLGKRGREGGGTPLMDEDEDEEGLAGVKLAAAKETLTRERNGRVVLVEVAWDLECPRSGLVFRMPRDGFSAPHLYTTYSHAPIDMDGPRCWFPCLDTTAKGCIYEVHVSVASEDLSVAFNGKLLGRKKLREDGQDGVSHRYITESLTGARRVGLVVGFFAPWCHPATNRIRGLFLKPEPRHSGVSSSNALGLGGGGGGEAGWGPFPYP